MTDFHFTVKIGFTFVLLIPFFPEPACLRQKAVSFLEKVPRQNTIVFVYLPNRSALSLNTDVGEKCDCQMHGEDVFLTLRQGDASVTLLQPAFFLVNNGSLRPRMCIYLLLAIVCRRQ